MVGPTGPNTSVKLKSTNPTLNAATVTLLSDPTNTVSNLTAPDDYYDLVDGNVVFNIFDGVNFSVGRIGGNGGITKAGEEYWD